MCFRAHKKSAADSPLRKTKATVNVVSSPLVDPPMLYEAKVASCQKPRALDCSGADYVATVESELTASVSDQAPRFELRWSKPHQTLTFMEKTAFAMKFCTIQFTETNNVETWHNLLQQVAAHEKNATKVIVEKEHKVQQCEAELRQKEALLEKALVAKQEVEDEWFHGFCAVLNAKKDEIRSLQREVETIKDMQRHFEGKPTRTRKVAAPRGRPRARGAKLEKKAVEVQNEDVSDESMESHTSKNESDAGDESEKQRAKVDAIKAYSALPSTARSHSVQISSADDLLLSMDSIIEEEEKRNEATQRDEAWRGNDTIKSEPMTTQPQARGSPSVQSRTNKLGAGASKPSARSELVRSEPHTDEPMQSDEDDLLDMLS
ncbi:hypothetical protein PsorP6_015652 [Peronosclerospora sorghi]|uniref:Uncharacterized protein n=1 Tax=Peronosclerospora sorghi TaxID=230839 RepID=A0ACC0WMN1_9STRA|nr:hypothetical protein PsorP6_015652 [Peronosclerospora sorghi]